MTLSATLTLKRPAPAEVLRLRDEMWQRCAAARQSLPPGVHIQLPDFYQWALVDKACDDGLKSAEVQLISAAKKLGLKPRGAPDVSYGVHGSWEGAVDFWYQITAD